MTDIRQTLRNIVRDELCWEGEIAGQTLVETFDSLQLLTLVVAVEDQFRIELAPADEERIDTLDDLVELIEAKRRG